MLAPGEAIPCAAPMSAASTVRNSSGSGSGSGSSSGSSSSGLEREEEDESGGAGAGAVSFLTGSSASAAIVTGFASLLFSALLENSSARQLLADTLNDDDISTFLRFAVMPNEKALTRQVHEEALMPECRIGTKETVLHMFLRSLHKLRDNLSQDHPAERPQGFHKLKSRFASFTKQQRLGKYEE